MQPLLVASDAKEEVFYCLMETLIDSIGNTPLLKVERALPPGGATLYAKLERFNPGVSIKDRLALAMVVHAEKTGVLKPGGTIIEPVAGNTGIALAHICNVLGYGLILTMPEDYMPERRHILEACGTRIVTTPAGQGVEGSIKRANELRAEHPDYCLLDHFNNDVQVEAHRKGLVLEILKDLDGTKIDAFVGCIGTGSSMAALAEALGPTGTQIVAVEPLDCPFLSKGRVGRHGIPGISFGFMPDYLSRDVINRVETVSDEQALLGFNELARETGVLAGLSSGANYIVAKKLAKELGAGKNILTIFYDGGERYFSLRESLGKTSEGI